MIPSQLEEVCVVPVGEVGGADAACSSEGESEGLIDYRFMCCHAGLAYRYVHDRNNQAEPDQRAVHAHGSIAMHATYSQEPRPLPISPLSRPGPSRTSLLQCSPTRLRRLH